jgi:gliding motility-associated-like protein
VLVNQFGCDSTVIITTTLLPRNTTVFFSQSCNPADTGTVTQILTNQFGCDSIVTTQVLLFSDPDYQLVADTLCAGESLVINGTVYDQERPIGQEVIQSLAEECDSVVIDIALVFAAPEAEIRPTNPACEGLTGFIEIGPPENGFPPYTITAAGQLLEDVSAFPVTIDVLAGDYTVELTDALGCTVSQPVSITEGISPALSIDGPLILEQGDTLTLRPMINFDPVTLEWRPAGQLSCSDCLNPVLEASESTTLLLTASLGNGCSATANVQVLVERQVDIYAPNIFSPNGDGRNDRFTLFSAPGQIDQIERMEIYDRWGNQVFAQTEFPANNVAVGWDGTFRGEPMGPGVFTYYAQVRLPTGRIILQKGDVTLIR